MNSFPGTVLIIGANGFLGQVLCNIPRPGLARIPVSRIASTKSKYRQMDITILEQVESVINEVAPEWVINTAAVTNVDWCEKNPKWARKVHVDGTRNLIQACEKAGSGLISISTNYVFDGVGNLYEEEDKPNPLNVYGQTKSDCESLALRADCKSIVVRTAVLYGYCPGCRPNFLTWAVGSLAHGKKIRVVTDEWANPTYVNELAKFLLMLCREDFQGLIHFGGQEFFTRYEMVKQICSCYSLDFTLVTPVTSSEMGQVARRPLRAGLKIERARKNFGWLMVPFEENLQNLAASIGTG